METASVSFALVSAVIRTASAGLLVGVFSATVAATSSTSAVLALSGVSDGSLSPLAAETADEEIDRLGIGGHDATRRPYELLPGFLTGAECRALIAAAREAGLQPSLKTDRALDPLPLATALSRSRELDLNADGTLDAREVAVAVRRTLNAPLFDDADARKWLLAAVGKLNVSTSLLPSLLDNIVFAGQTRRFFQEMLTSRPEKFSRFSEQAPLQWADLASSTDNVTRGAAERLVWLLSDLDADDRRDGSVVSRNASRAAAAGASSAAANTFDGEPLQVIHYGARGHYAPHSDSGWPGHRPFSVLVYLETPPRDDPAAGGETCFLPLAKSPADLHIARRVDAAAYARRCAPSLVATRAATCVTPALGDAVVWHSHWRGSSGLEVPGAHVACPLLRGEKWVASAWTQGARARPH
eukprot:TRINITY_DN42827_c0_g1_i1.p1 TRINITY_DN42827_c0_g1~~TRINITY_DN42827_c0_g1_i1.p1  ORF type:complete len:413 (-),score=56.20 TRINITY_DN42827_c0_g1_i1:268-1506(-)